MSKLTRLNFAIATLVLTLEVTSVSSGASAPAETMIAHMVYFDLKNPSEAAQQRLIDACHKYLKQHPGVVFFAAGRVAEDLKREVNVRDFHVSLHIVFKTKADHDRYQTAPAHLQFIKENEASFARVRVFDSYVR